MTKVEPSSLRPVLVKVCGLTNVEEALACAQAGVDWIGLNFSERSPRRIDPALAAEIVSALPGHCAAVGLFVNSPPKEVASTADRVGLRIVQLHGDEPPEDLVSLSAFDVVRAFRLANAESIERLRTFLDRAGALGRVPFAVLVDGFVPGQAGGTGRLIDSDLIGSLPSVPRLILAGGLTPENVADRVATARPWMVDVASGVERTPGRKDLARVAAFVAAARGFPVPKALH
ncbi:MAG: phosphoribosylanthranilate isomerase [Isosphaeraceae bacterium]